MHLRLILVVRPRIRPRHDALPRRKRRLVPTLLRQRTAIAVPANEPRHIRPVPVPLRRFRLARLARLAWGGRGRRRGDGRRRAHAAHRDERLERLVRRQHELVAEKGVAGEVLRGGWGAYHRGVGTSVVEAVGFLLGPVGQCLEGGGQCVVPRSLMPRDRSRFSVWPRWLPRG